MLMLELSSMSLIIGFHNYFQYLIKIKWKFNLKGSKLESKTFGWNWFPTEEHLTRSFAQNLSYLNIKHCKVARAEFDPRG